MATKKYCTEYGLQEVESAPEAVSCHDNRTVYDRNTMSDLLQVVLETPTPAWRRRNQGDSTLRGIRKVQISS